jgi:hypothetical protein
LSRRPACDRLVPLRDHLSVLDLVAVRDAMGRVFAKVCAVAVGSVLVLLAVAGPASADPARPTNYRSEVTRLEPPTDAVAVDVIGGDSFLRIVVEPGHEVVVLGYSGEPYARILADGTVEQNERSPAVLLNSDRYARVGAQNDLSDEEIRAMEPDWRQIGSDATFVWHDHNSHWMSTTLPPQLDGEQSGVVFDDWVVPIVVDGVSTEVHGRLVRDAPPSVLPWLLLAAVFAAAVVAVAWRTDRLVAVGAALTVLAAGAFAVSLAGQLDMPTEAGRQYHLVIVPAIAMVAGLAGLVLRRTAYGPALVAGAALALPIWIFGMFGVLSHAHAPTEVAEGVQRTVIALAIGAVAAAAVVALLQQRAALRSR